MEYNHSNLTKGVEPADETVELKLSPLEKTKLTLAKKAAIVKRAFSTEEGRKVLGYLEDEFEKSDLADADVYKTYYNLGARDLLTYIKQLIRYDEEMNND